MKKRISFISAIALCVAGLFFISGTSLSAEFKFREFNADREKFERYTDNAEKSINEQEWQNILDSGKQEMHADWERNSAAEMERYLRQDGDETEVRNSMEESRGEWEIEYEKAEAYAKGAWFVKRENLIFDSVDFSSLKRSVIEAGGDNTLDSVEAWDNYISSSLSEVNLSWDIKFIPLFESIKTGGDLLAGDIKSGFDAELAEFENELRRKFEVERNTIVYSGRNAFITELYIDTESLKYQSAEKSADASTGNIIKEVQESLKSEEDKILTKSYNSEGVSTVDLSGMGDNWEEELKQLVNTGMEKWNGALDRLYQQMLLWKQGADDAYNSAEALWRKAAEKLEQAKLEWEIKLSKEIYEALDNWKREESELTQSIEIARQDFNGYMSNLSGQWNDHSSGLIDMAVNGSRVYTEALENIKWLEKMSKENENNITGAFGKNGEVKQENAEFYSILDMADKDNITNTIGSLPKSFVYNGIDYGFIFPFEGAFYYTGGFYTYEYSDAVEKPDVNKNWYLTESYTVRIYGKKMTYTSREVQISFSEYRTEYYWAESIELVKTLTVTNDVTAESSAKEKSTYYYYKTELERWKKIRDSFAGIAAEAETYMHEKNMLGEQNGPGYLNNAGGSDPYLMTDAEFALQIASRDRDFWQKRLDIAKAVLDYAEKAKGESSGTTETNKIAAEENMKTAKLLYETTLGEVDEIVSKLKILQGQKPAGERNSSNEAGWLAYLGSIEYITAEYNKANVMLQTADKDYSTRKRALILLKNNENKDYLLKEIHEIEKNILQADRDLYQKQIELYKKQFESEYSGRTAGFARNYEAVVKSYEESKLKFNTLKNILTGEENDTTLIAWGTAIINAKDLLWEENGDQYSGMINNLITGYTPEKRELLSSAIRNIYFNLQFNMESAELIITKLRDSSFDPDEFIEKENSTNHNAYRQYADRSVKALEIIDKAMELAESSGNKNYTTIIEYLRTEFAKEKYIYGNDNTQFIEHYTALKYFEDRYKGLTAEAWESSRDRLEDEIRFAEKASELHSNFNTLSADELASMISENEIGASIGDMDAVAILREYYISGSGIAGLGYIDDFDKDAEKAYNLNESLKAYVSENYRYFQKGQSLLAGHSYLNDMLGYINSVVSLASGSGESLLTAEDFKTLTPESLSIAAGAIKDFIRKLDTDNIPIPDFLLTAADAILEVKERLDTGLFIRRYMTNDSSAEMAGSVDDVYARKLKESQELKVVTEFIDYCGDKLESGAGDDYTLAMNILSEYETLSEANKEYLKNHEDEKIKAVDQFIENLYLYRYTINLNNLALQYTDSEFSVTPEQFAADKELDDTSRDKLTTIIKPVYERRIFDNGYKNGNIKDINKYISEGISAGKISSEEGKTLKAYAVINEYLFHASCDMLTSTDPAFVEYIKYKKFENYILTVSKDAGDNNEQYAEKCASAYHGINGGELSELTDFAESFINRDLTAFSYLDIDVKIYAASKYYYDEMFSKNRVPVNGIESLLEDEFGEDSINGTVIDAVKAYSGRLNTVSFYYGGDLDKYTENMDMAVKDYFLMYINGMTEAILPGFEYGIYKTGYAHGGVMVELGKLEGELDRYAAGFSELENHINNYRQIAETGIKNADALKALFASGEQGNNWRGDMLAITEGDVLVTPTPVTNLSEWSDSYDSTSGLRKSVVYSNTPLDRDGKKFSLHGIIDDMNKISSLFNSLSEAMKPGYKPDAALGITAFLHEVDNFYTVGNSYSYEIESLLRGAVSGYEAISENRISEVSALTGTLSGMDSNIENIKSTFASKKISYNLLTGGKSKPTLLAELELSREEHEKAKREVEDYRQKLSDARKVYETANTGYVKKMNLVSDTYTAYKGLEFDYEKAYSIWEYAKTPYLHDDKTDTGDIGSGQTPSGGNTDYGDIPVPDARDNYQRILARYTQSLKMYNEKALAVTNQDTVEKLNADAEYAKLKADFIRKSESYIRTAQVNTEINEDLEIYEYQYNVSKQIYENAKNSFTPYTLKLNEISGESEAVKKDLARQRDQILAHILKTGGDLNSTELIQRYMNGLSWYSCVKSDRDNAASVIVINEKIAQLRAMGYQSENSQAFMYSTELAKLKSDLAGISEIAGSNAQHSAMYNGLSDEIKNDIEKIYAVFITAGAGDNLQIIQTNYYQSMYWKREYEYAVSMVHRYRKKRHYFSRKKWEAKRDSRAVKYTNFNNAYLAGINPISNSLIQAAKDKVDFGAKTTELQGVSSVRTLDEVKDYLKQGKYNMTDEDLNHLYDSSTGGLTDDKEGINLDLLRIQNETQRTDLDGESVYASVNGDIVTILDKDGKAIEVYRKDDPSIRLELKDGKYLVYDRTYNISAIAGILKGESEKYRQKYYAELMNYTRTGVATGTRDNTVVLKDLEKTYHDLQGFAETFNLTIDPNGEKRQRGLEGYGVITKEYVNNGKDESIQGMIMEALMKQSSALQNQLWQQQIEKFRERKNRWNEVTGFILNRGMQEWRENYSEFKNLWTKWRFDAKKMIIEGENWWAGVSSAMTQDMTAWSEETSKSSSKEAAQQIYSDLEGRISRYETDLKKKMPGNASFELNTDQILNQAMKNRPVDSIGILTQTMQSTDTTAGFTNLLNLGLSSSLFKYNEQQMEEYTNAMGVMKNLQVIDILNSIIEGFNKQLVEANKNVYEGVDTNIRRNETFGIAPFNRRDSENIWDIRVCVESNLTGDKFKTRRFTDYNKYINSTVYFQPIKGLNGTTIDFTQANTYSNIDGEDLETYVGLESEWLSRKIEGVFGADGTFSSHQQTEYTRLGESFGQYYGDWMAGEALQNAGFYAKPMFPKGPNMMTAAAIAATFSGNPWLAIAINAAATGVQVADGTLAWQHAGVQMGVGAVSGMSGGFAPLVQMAASGIDYEEGGGIGWNKDKFKQGVKGGVVKLGVQFAMSQIGGESFTGRIAGSMVTSTVMSGLETDGGWGNIGFDTSNWSQHITTGIAAGITTALAGEKTKDNPNGNGIWGNEALGQMVEQGIMTAAYRFRGGKGFENDNSSFNWNAMAPSAQKLGEMLGGMASKKLDEMAKKHNERGESGLPNGAGFLDFAEDMLGGLWQGAKDTKKWITDIGESIKNTALDGIKDLSQSAGNWVTGDGFNTDDEVTDIKVARYKELLNNPVLLAANGGSSAGLESEAMAWEEAEARTVEMNKLASELGISPEVNLKLQQQAIAGTGETVESKFKQGTSLDKYVKRIAGAYGMDDSADVMNRLLELNDCSEAELRSRMASGKPIIEDASMKWNSNVQAKYDKEASAKIAAQNQALNNNAQNFDLDYNTAGPNWGGDFSIINAVTSFFRGEKQDSARQDFNFAQRDGVDVPFAEGTDFRLTSPFDERDNPTGDGREFHKGIDLGAAENTPVYAPRDGVAKLFHDKGDGYGNQINIGDGNGNYDLLGHLSGFNIKQGQSVRRGDLVGYVGSTGRSTGMHLHYGVYINGSPVNPLRRR